MKITTNNYFREIEQIGLDKLPDVLKKSHEFVLKVTNNGSQWNTYFDSESIRKTIDLYFEKLEAFASPSKPGKAPKPPKIKKEKAPKVKPAKAPKAPKAAKPKKEPKGKPIPANIHRVEHLKDEMKFIKRFVGLHNKIKTQNQVLNFVRGLQRAIVQKIITKTSPYADEIRYIQDKLLKAYNAMTDKIHITINDQDLSRFVNIAGGEQVYVSIPIIKRYIGMEGKIIEPAKINKFIEHIERTAKKEKLLDDPYADKVNKIRNTLKKYLDGKQAHINVSETELNGLAKIAKSCGCHHSHSIAGTGRRVYSHRGQSLSGIVTAEQVANQHFDLLPFSEQWANLLGKPAKNFTMMLHGEPGSGKTTFMMKFVKYLSSMGSVLYVSSEEFNSATLTQKVRQYLYPMPQNLHFSSDIHGVDAGAYDFVVLDSINDLGLDLNDFKAMKEANSRTAFILILQHTKSGQFRGGKEWEHEAEIAGQVTDGNISIYKNRYGVKGNMNFFN